MAKRKSRKDNAGQRNRTWQMLLWCGVILIQMTALAKMDVHAMGIQSEKEGEGEEPSQELTVWSDYFRKSEDCPMPEKDYVTEEGIRYRLESWETEKTVVPARHYPVEQEEFVCRQEGIARIPEYLAVTVEERGQQYEVVCDLSEQTMTKEEWQDGFCFPVTFHGYYADSYWLGDQLVYREGETPKLEGYEELLLQEIGVSPKEYRITDIQWNGDPYEDETGEFCRDAMAVGQKMVRDYRLIYRGMAELPSYEVFRTAAVYRWDSQREEIDEGQEQVQLPKAVRIEEEKAAAASLSEGQTLWEKITRILLVTIAIGAALFFGGLFLLGILWLIRSIKPYSAAKDKRRKESHCIFRGNTIRYRRNKDGTGD